LNYVGQAALNKMETIYEYLAIGINTGACIHGLSGCTKNSWEMKKPSDPSHD
jgi:hypothetical protein